MVLNIVVNFLWGYVNLGEGENMVKMGVFGHILRYFEGFWGYFAEQLTWGLVFEGILGSNLGPNLGWGSIWGILCEFGHFVILVILGPGAHFGGFRAHPDFGGFWAILGVFGFWGFLVVLGYIVNMVDSMVFGHSEYCE